MLSKSKYCAFSQCPKRLWLQTYRPELSEDNAALDTRMETGNEVGDLVSSAALSSDNSGR